MPVFAQSSQFPVPLTEATHLLRYAPFSLRTPGNASLLHYYAPHGIWQGAPVLYSLVKGMHVIRWQASVLNPTGRGFFVRSTTSPWGEFRATHLFESIESGILIRDELQGSQAECAELWAHMHLVYGFDQRLEMQQMQAKAPTQELPRLESGFSAG